MTITRLPLANIEKHGAQLFDNSDAGFTIKAASGALLGTLPRPPVPWLLEHDNPTSAPIATWAAQKSIEAYAEFDSEIVKLKRDDTISETERLRRLHLIRKKTEDAMAHIELAFAAGEAEVLAAESAHYSWRPLEADDVVGALRDNEIRSGLRTMSESDIAPIMRRVNSGEDRAIIEAVLRSPLNMGRFDQFAQSGWRALRDREDPQKRAGIDLRKSYDDWGRRIVGAVQGSLAAKLRVS
jgi:hypothetical protein